MHKGFNDIYLQLEIRKSKNNTCDEYGNPYFEVEASNENLDLQNQIVLQQALLKSKKNFIQNGFISYDHLYKTKDENGVTVSDSRYLIGEPVDVYTDGKSTIVKGKLYKSNELAKDIISKLRDGSKRIRASVGGLFPKIEKDKNGIEKIYSVLWNDLALTPTPVNNTVGNATLCKSLKPDEFIKSLEAGYGTDHASFENGRALQKEDIGDTVDITSKSTGIENKLINAINEGICFNEPGSMNRFLINNGINNQLERNTIINNVKNKLERGKGMKKSALVAEATSILKSLDDKEKEIDDQEYLDLDDELEDEDEEEEDESEKSVKKGCKKSLDDDGVDATDLIKSLVETIQEQSDRITDLEKSFDDMADLMTKSLNEPNEVRSTLNKSINSTSTSGRSDRPSQAEFDKVKDILIKSVANNEISILDSTKMESEVQACMNTGCKMSDATFNFIKNRM